MSPTAPRDAHAGDSKYVTFHRATRVLSDARPAVPPEMSAHRALRLLEQLGVSHVAVVTGDVVLGLFSFRSFALGAAEQPSNERSRLVDLPVEEFLEPLTAIRGSDSVEEAIPQLHPRGAIFVEDSSESPGVATTADFLRYMRDFARPFLLLQEIELALRGLLSACLLPDEVRECARQVLAAAYSNDITRLPTDLGGMTLGDYVTLVGDGRTWRIFPQVSAVFGGTRERALSKLKGIHAIRNDVFHFRRTPTLADLQQLKLCREWLARRTTIAERAKNDAISSQRVQKSEDARE